MTPYHPNLDAAHRRARRAEQERDAARAELAALWQRFTRAGGLEYERLAALVDALTEENRVLRLANRSLAGVRDV